MSHHIKVVIGASEVLRKLAPGPFKLDFGLMLVPVSRDTLAALGR